MGSRGDGVEGHGSCKALIQGRRLAFGKVGCDSRDSMLSGLVYGLYEWFRL
jgi:hypothetical protein